MLCSSTFSLSNNPYLVWSEIFSLLMRIKKTGRAGFHEFRRHNYYFFSRCNARACVLVIIKGLRLLWSVRRDFYSFALPPNFLILQICHRTDSVIFFFPTPKRTVPHHSTMEPQAAHHHQGSCRAPLAIVARH